MALPRRIDPHRRKPGSFGSFDVAAQAVADEDDLRFVDSEGGELLLEDRRRRFHELVIGGEHGRFEESVLNHRDTEDTETKNKDLRQGSPKHHLSIRHSIFVIH
jgi:hypothetical protein